MRYTYEDYAAFERSWKSVYAEMKHAGCDVFRMSAGCYVAESGGVRVIADPLNFTIRFVRDTDGLVNRLSAAATVGAL